jgi:putative ABC transport system ATP-binding protein
LEVRGGELVGLLSRPAPASRRPEPARRDVPPSAGKIFLGDTELSGLSERDLDDLRATRVSMMPVGAPAIRVPYRDPEQRAFAQRWTCRRRGDPARPEILAAVGLADQAHLPLAVLPAGQLQLAAVAVALALARLAAGRRATSLLDHAARDRAAGDRLANRELGTTVLLSPTIPRSPMAVLHGHHPGRQDRRRGPARREYAVVTADGFLPLPAHTPPSLPPGTLVRVRPVPEGFLSRSRTRRRRVAEGAGTVAGRRRRGPLRRAMQCGRRVRGPARPDAGRHRPSGAGVVLLWALAGATAHAGTVAVGGVPVAGRTEAAEVVSRSPAGQRAAPVPHRRKRPHAAAGRGRAGGRRAAWSRAAPGRCWAGDLANHLVDEPSGGQQQRVALARTLAAAPAVVLADEPTSDLDAANRQRVVDALRAEAEAGAVVVMATHDAEAAAGLDAELRLDDGRMSWQRPPATPWQ